MRAKSNLCVTKSVRIKQVGPFDYLFTCKESELNGHLSWDGKVSLWMLDIFHRKNHLDSIVVGSDKRNQPDWNKIMGELL